MTATDLIEALKKIKDEATGVEAMKAPARALGSIAFMCNDALRMQPPPARDEVAEVSFETAKTIITGIIAQHCNDEGLVKPWQVIAAAEAIAASGYLRTASRPVDEGCAECARRHKNLRQFVETPVEQGGLGLKPMKENEDV